MGFSKGDKVVITENGNGLRSGDRGIVIKAHVGLTGSYHLVAIEGKGEKEVHRNSLMKT